MKIVLTGALSLTYDGNNGKTLKEMFPTVDFTQYVVKTAKTRKVTSVDSRRTESSDFFVEDVAATATAEQPPAAPAQTAAPAEAPAAADEPAVAAKSIVPPVAEESITVTLSGGLTETYTGPRGKTLKQLFPALGNKTYQVREGTKLVGQAVPWQTSATLTVVEHARHG